MSSGTTSATRKRIGEILVQEGLITSEQLIDALQKQKETGNRVVRELVNLGHLDIDRMAKFLSKDQGIPSIDLANYNVPEKVCALVPKEFALTNEVFPIDHLGKLLTVGMAFPLDRAAIEELEKTTGLRVKALLCSAADIREAIRRYYPDDESQPAEPTAEGLANDLKLGSIVDLIHSIEDLPTLPDTVQQVQQLTDASTSSMKHIAEVISRDPAITAKMLQLANSPIYGFTSRVDTIERATTLLGLKETFMVVLSAAVIDLTQSANHFDHEQYWAESMTCAAACRLLAQEKGQRPEGALPTAGLLCGIGRFALSEAVPARYVKIDSALRGADLLEAEEKVLGIGHPEAGYELVSNWSLPEEITTAIRFHIHPDQSELHRETVGTVALATYQCCLKFNNVEPSEDVFQVHENTLTLAGLTPAQAMKAYGDLLAKN